MQWRLSCWQAIEVHVLRHGSVSYTHLGREYGYLNAANDFQKTVIAAQNGNTLYTTIDANIQSIVEDVYKRQVLKEMRVLSHFQIASTRFARKSVQRKSEWSFRKRKNTDN